MRYVRWVFFGLILVAGAGVLFHVGLLVQNPRYLKPLLAGFLGELWGQVSDLNWPLLLSLAAVGLLLWGLDRRYMR